MPSLSKPLSALLFALTALSASACSSSAPVSREGVVVQVLIEEPDSRALPIVAEECRALITEALEDEGVLVVSGDDVASVSSRTTVTLTLSRGAIDLVDRDSAGSRILSWLFLGPVYFFMHDHTFELRCEPSLAFTDDDGAALSPTARYPQVRVREDLNYNQWSQSLAFYLLSNLVPPFWAEPDGEVLTRNLFESTARELAKDVAQALRDPAAWQARRASLMASSSSSKPEPIELKEEPARRYRVLWINPDVQSPIEVLSPRADAAVVGTSVPVRLSLTRRQQIRRIIVGERALRPPFTADVLEVEAPIEGKRARLKIDCEDAPPLTVVIAFEDAPPPPKTYVLRRINPILKGPIQIQSPKVGERFSGEEIPIAFVITQPDLVDAIELGPRLAEAPFESLKIERLVGLRDGRVTILIRKRGEAAIAIALEFEEVAEPGEAAKK